MKSEDAARPFDHWQFLAATGKLAVANEQAGEHAVFQNRTSGKASCRSSAIDHPGCAELVDEHAKTQCPESFLDRHLHRAVFGQRLEDAFRVRRTVNVEQNREALRFLILSLERVGARQQYLVTQGECGMEDLLVSVGGRLFGNRRIAVCQHYDNSAAQALLVKLESRLALAVEYQMGIQFHLHFALL
jgi:hypothetical protein